MQPEFEFRDQQEAQRALRANLSPRYCRLEFFEKWVEGRQYDGMPGWWDASDDVPLWDRAPCVVYPVVDIAANSYVDLLLGQGRFPTFTAKSEDKSDEDFEGGLNDEEATILDRFIREYHRVCRFRAVSRDQLYSAMGCGSSASVLGVRGGRPFQDIVPAKWCEPTLDQDGAVVRMEIRYPYLEQYRNERGDWHVRAKLYRRVITDEDDTEYFPADASALGTEPAWRANPERSVKHGLGFCPVIWYPFMRGAVPVNVIDGKPIHQNITDEIRAHDIARSQWHRGALLSEPQPWEAGVEPGYSPTESGRFPLVTSTEKGGLSSATNPVTGGYGAVPKKARKKGPGHVWQYPSPDTKIGVITYPGEALKAQEDNCRDLRIKLQEALAVVFLDPESIKFAATTSGKALEAIKQKQLDRCDQIRDDLTDRYFEPAISMQLRIAHSVLGRGQVLKVPGAKRVKPILDKFAVREAGKLSWQIPSIQTIWGSYFKLDAAEQQKIVSMVVQAIGAGVPLITVRLALRKLAPIFEIENIAAVEAELEEEAKKRQKRAQDQAEAELRALHEAAANADAGRDRGGGREEPAEDPGGGGVGSSAAAEA